jgi:hypothetical protein
MSPFMLSLAVYGYRGVFYVDKVRKLSLRYLEPLLNIGV